MSIVPPEVLSLFVLSSCALALAPGPDNIFVLTAKLSILGMVTASVYNWNESMALWVEDAVLFIPNITKTYIFRR